MFQNYSFAVSKERIQAELGRVLIDSPLALNYNISATEKAYIIKASKPFQLEKLEWGLIPEWSKDGKNAGNLLSMGHVGISSKISFRIPLRKRRCLVPADSFYLWSKENIPYRIARRDGALMYFAGVWEIWQKQNQIKKSFSIITCPSNKEVYQLSHQMPVLLSTVEERENWLFTDQLSTALNLLKSPENSLFNMYRVTDKIKDPSFNKSEIHAAVPDLKTLFD